MLAYYTKEFEELKCLLSAYCNEEEGKDKESKNALIGYLLEQEMNFIKCIQVVFHLGRNPERYEGNLPETLYEKTMRSFDTLKGWRSKEIEIRNMIIKIPLDVYFAGGLQVLGMGKGTSNDVETDNLKLRPLSFDDLEDVYHLASAEEVAQYMRFDRHENKEQTKALLSDYIENKQHNALAIIEKASGAFVGVFVFKQNEEEASDYSLTTFNGKAFWNKGYSTEILQAAMPYAKEVLGAKTLRAYVISQNKGSCKVLEKSNFKVVKILEFEDLPCPLLVYKIDL